MVWILAFFTLAGINFSFWALIGIARFIFEKIPRTVKRKRGRPPKPITPKDVVAIIPAHNEQQTIKRTIKALLVSLSKRNIYVASDYSTDKTVKIAKSLGVRVLDIKPNMGKAKALVYTMKHYKLLKRFKVILINDADVEIDKFYLDRALPLFKDKKIAAIAPHGVGRPRNYRAREMLFIAYRIRLWRIIQTAMRFGQTWKFTNVTFIVPGSLCLYRTSVIKKIQIDVPGLVIEDYNMTFELHKKRLGRIFYHPSIFGIHQDPYTLKDYINQVKRWNLGFWQTVKRNGVWPSFFWLATGSFIVELSLYAIFIIIFPALLVVSLFHIPFESIIPWSISISDLLIGVFFMDYIMTVIAAILEKKPSLLFYGLGFFFLRYIDALIHIYTIPLALFTHSEGTWNSPKRR